MQKDTKRILILLSCLLLAGTALLAQGRELRQADAWYGERAYARAIPAYEKALRERYRESVARKLARCYQMTNAWDKAGALLDTAVLKDRSAPDLWCLYGEALMAAGRYGEARSWFQRCAEASPEDSTALLRAEACLRVAEIRSLFGTVRTEALPINTEADEHAAVPWEGGLVFTSDRPHGIHPFREKSRWTGRDYLSLFFSRPLNDTAWTEPEPWSARLNSLNINTGYATFSPDSLELVFTRNAREPDAKGLQNLQLFQARRQGDGWSRPEPLGIPQEHGNRMHPTLSPDGKWLVFASDRSGGSGGLDLWICARNGKGWGRPEPIAAPLNTPFHEGFPCFAADGSLYFSSKGHAGFGGYDLFVTRMLPDGRWEAPRNLGRPLNSPADDLGIWVAPDNRSGYFSSTRDGGDDDLFRWHAE